MTEPTIPEAVVEAAARALFELVHPPGTAPSWEEWRSEFGPGDSYHRQARAALAAAEPLMHERCVRFEEEGPVLDVLRRVRAEHGRLRAENARLREALEELADPHRHYTDAVAHAIAHTALAPSNKEPGT